MGLDIDTGILVEQPADHLLCAICHGLQDKPTLICPGGHTYCKDCISTWQERSSNCPGCRFAITATFSNLPLKCVILALKVKCPNESKAAEDAAAIAVGDENIDTENSNVAKKRPANKSTSKGKAKNKAKKQKKSTKVQQPDEEDEDDLDTKPAAKLCCPWEGTLEDYLEKHKEECPFAEVQCDKCGINVKASEVDNHKNTVCVVPCPDCEKRMPVSFLALHAANKCPNSGVPCPDCQIIVPRKNMGSETYDEKQSLHLYTGHRANCPEAVVCCEFQGMGCKVGSMKRKELAAHHAKAASASLHSNLAAKAVQEGWASRRRPWHVCERWATNEKTPLDAGFSHIESNHVQVGKYTLFFRLEEVTINNTIRFKLCSEAKEGLEAPLVQNITVSIPLFEHWVRINPIRQLEPDLTIGDGAASIGDMFHYGGDVSKALSLAELRRHSRFNGLKLNVGFQIRDYDPRLAAFF